jgi:hypothetical protein
MGSIIQLEAQNGKEFGLWENPCKLTKGLEMKEVSLKVKSIFVSAGFLLLASCSGNSILISPDGGWNWDTHPIATYHHGNHQRTYVGWVTSVGDVQVTSYDHVTKQIETSTLHQKLDVDDHANPSLLMLEDGRVMAFYSAHNGDALYFRTTKESEDVSSWNPEQTMPVNSNGTHGYTYPKPCILKNENNALYVFWRGGDWLPTFSVSYDNGTTWSEARTLFRVPGERPYVIMSCDGVSKIDFTVSDGHPNEVKNNNVYYFRYQSGKFINSNGEFIGNLNTLPLTRSDVDLVYDAKKEGASSWVWDITTDSTGAPYIAFATFPSVVDHQYRYAKTVGTKWQHFEITSAGTHLDGDAELYYSGGIAFAPNNPSIVFLSRQVGKYHEIQRWVTPDHGKTWNSFPVSLGISETNARPVVVGRPSDEILGVLWWSGVYNYYTDYQSTIRAVFY